MTAQMRPGWHRKESGIYRWRSIGTVYSLDGEVTWCWSIDDGEIRAKCSGYRTAWKAMVKCSETYRELSKTPFSERAAAKGQK